MFRFALTRIAMALPTLLIVAVSVFVLIRLIPGDPAQMIAGEYASEADIARNVATSLAQTYGVIFQTDAASHVDNPPDDWAAFVRDHDGNKLVAVCERPE